MKIWKDSFDNLHIDVSENEFKKAFESPENLQEFRDDLIRIAGTFYQLQEELNNGK